MKSRIINCISLKDGGGKTYLYLLHSFLDTKDNLLILDYRFKKSHISFKKAKVIFLQKSLFRNLKVFIIRYSNYLKYFFISNKTNNKLKKFEEIYLNGIPPFIRFKNSQIYIFAQNRLIFENSLPKSFNLDYLKLNFYLFIQKTLFSLFLRDSDLIIVQTNSMFKLVSKCLKNKILLQEKIWGEFNFNELSFIKNNINNLNLDLINKIKDLSSKNVLFFYPASYYQHKNHKKLIEAFNMLFQYTNLSCKLILTLEIYELKKIIKINQPHFICLGKLDYENIIRIYDYIDYLVYPSLYESYGLPLIEASTKNVKIIASDLDYVYEVCKPFLTFDPLSTNDIFIKIKSLLHY